MTATAHLVFDRPPATSGHLVFGQGAPIALVTGQLQAAFPAPTASGSAGTIFTGHLQARAPQPAATATAEYLSLTQRPTVAQAAAQHQQASASSGAAKSRHQQAQSLPAAYAAKHQQATQAAASTRHVWPGLLVLLYIDTKAQHQDATSTQTGAAVPHQDGAGLWQQRDTQHQDAAPVQRSAGMPHEDGTPIWQQRDTRHQDARRVIRGHAAKHQRATERQHPWRPRHQDARTPPAGRAVWPLPPQPPQRQGDPHLVFACPPSWPGAGPVHLVFGRVCAGPFGPLAPFAIHPARFYMAVHTLTAHTLPGMQPVPIFGVSLSADAGSFAWTFSASGPASLFDQLAPAAGLPAQIQINLDGAAFVFLVDSIKRTEAFGKRGAQISGRSATALLARPYARETARLSTADATAQQLALQALEFSGAALDWGLADWLVPAGAWSHTGTPLAAVQAIAEAAGGYIQSHRTAATLLARHPYPTLPGGFPGGPWGWSGAFAADVDLAPDAIITSGIERKDGPDINAVWVSGTNQGILARVKRTGTAADKLASLITDPLITAPEAAQQRGLSVLGAAGPKHLVQIELPILTGAGQPGVLDVGQLVQINEASPWRGRVRSVSVNATMPRARQTIQLERHLEIA